MGAVQDFNKPAFTNALDADLDAIRDNYHFLMCVAATGSIVLPGWQTTVTATDYSEPDTITLTRGTKRIIINYTWNADGSVNTIQPCYDDGVSSPGLTCFDALTIYYDDAGNVTGTVEPVVSAFEDTIEALSPLAWYQFRDDNFSTIADSSGNGYDMSPVYAAAARDTSSLIRSTHPGGAIFPSVTNTNFSSTGVTYTAGSAPTIALSGSSGATILLSMRWETDSGQIGKLFGFMEDATLGIDELIGFNVAGSTNQLELEAETDSGTSTRGAAATADSVNKLLIGRWDGSNIYYYEIDPTSSPVATTNSGARTGNLVTVHSPGTDLTLFARNTASTSNRVVIDQAALFSTDIGATAVQNLIDAWLNEAVV